MIKHLNLYSAYSLLNKNLILTYKIDGVPVEGNNYNMEIIDSLKYPYPKNLEFNKFLNYTKTSVINLTLYSSKQTADYILNKKHMISKLINNEIIKNFFFINSSNIFELLELLKKPYKSPFKNDGFIIYNLDSQLIYKLKPFNEMTIDLIKRGKFFYSNDVKLNISVEEFKNTTNGIFRLHPVDKTGNLWKLGKKRNDKLRSNPLWLISEIINLVKLDLNYLDLKNIKINSYYNLYDTSYEVKLLLKNRKQKLLRRLENLVTNTSTIIDFGCGYGNYINNFKFRFYLGIDIDLAVLNSIITKRNCKELWLDFSNNLSIESQVNKFGEIWKKTQLKNYKRLKDNYSLIIFNHSIHNVKNLHNILNFIKTNYLNCFIFIGTFNITESFENKYQKMIILEETDKKYKVEFYNCWIKKKITEEYYKINYLRKLLTKYQINHSIQPYNPSIIIN